MKELGELGLPLLFWGKWDDTSPEGESWRESSYTPSILISLAYLLFNIGLRKHPDLVTLLQVVESFPQRLRLVWNILRRDFSNHYEPLLRDERNTKLVGEISFIPIEGTDDLGTISEVTRTIYRSARISFLSQVYLQPHCKILGFHQLHTGDEFKFASQLGVAEHPTISQLLSRLTSSPPTHITAQQCFEYLLTRLSGNYNICLEPRQLTPQRSRDGFESKRASRPGLYSSQVGRDLEHYHTCSMLCWDQSPLSL